tara:strand:+ start:653 stop:838 length:186 start_codon:yes stop_codon:yes gene_type:complete
VFTTGLNGVKIIQTGREIGPTLLPALLLERLVNGRINFALNILDGMKCSVEHKKLAETAKN